MDRNTQKTRMGPDQEKCYQTRTIEDENRVNGDTALIALVITKQLISITINGRMCNLIEIVVNITKIKVFNSKVLK